MTRPERTDELLANLKVAGGAPGIGQSWPDVEALGDWLLEKLDDGNYPVIAEFLRDVWLSGTSDSVREAARSRWANRLRAHLGGDAAGEAIATAMEEAERFLEDGERLAEQGQLRDAEMKFAASVKPLCAALVRAMACGMPFAETWAYYRLAGACAGQEEQRPEAALWLAAARLLREEVRTSTEAARQVSEQAASSPATPAVVSEQAEQAGASSLQLAARAAFAKLSAEIREVYTDDEWVADIENVLAGRAGEQGAQLRPNYYSELAMNRRTATRRHAHEIMTALGPFADGASLKAELAAKGQGDGSEDRYSITVEGVTFGLSREFDKSRRRLLINLEYDRDSVRDGTPVDVTVCLRDGSRHRKQATLNDGAGATEFPSLGISSMKEVDGIEVCFRTDATKGRVR